MGCAIPLDSIPCLIFGKHWALPFVFFLCVGGGGVKVFLVPILGFLAILHYSTQSLGNTNPMHAKHMLKQR